MFLETVICFILLRNSDFLSPVVGTTRLNTLIITTDYWFSNNITHYLLIFLYITKYGNDINLLISSVKFPLKSILHDFQKK